MTLNFISLIKTFKTFTQLWVVVADIFTESKIDVSIKLLQLQKSALKADHPVNCFSFGEQKARGSGVTGKQNNTRQIVPWV